MVKIPNQQQQLENTRLLAEGPPDIPFQKRRRKTIMLSLIWQVLLTTLVMVFILFAIFFVFLLCCLKHRNLRGLYRVKGCRTEVWESERCWVVGNKSKESVSCEVSRFSTELISEPPKRPQDSPPIYRIKVTRILRTYLTRRIINNAINL